MKRSEINAILRDADGFLKQHQFCAAAVRLLDAGGVGREGRRGPRDRRSPPWLGHHRLRLRATIRASGLFVFTLRNGAPESLNTGQGKFYAEKIMVVGVDQVTPLHFHWLKMEDIINRGGGKLVVQLYNSTEDEGLADTDVTVSIDGVRRTVPPAGR